MSSPSIAKFRRQLLERWIEDAIAFLDQIDGDPDYEDDELENDFCEYEAELPMMGGQGL